MGSQKQRAHKRRKDTTMKIETLNERLQKAIEKAAKKAQTIERKTAQIAKKEASLPKLTEQDRRWTEFDIQHLREDIERLGREIAETEKTIENYKAQLAGEIERQRLLTTEIPENMKRMQEDLVKGWDAYDKQRRDNLKALYREQGYREFMEHHTRADYEFKDLTDQQIHDTNLRDAESIILNLINRVKAITGEITNWSGIHATAGTWGFTVLNGVVEGKEGRCEVESIGAGGYNIQRFHIRVLVKPFN